jgi:hypothetical protein
MTSSQRHCQRQAKQWKNNLGKEKKWCGGNDALSKITQRNSI